MQCTAGLGVPVWVVRVRVTGTVSKLGGVQYVAGLGVPVGVVIVTVTGRESQLRGVQCAAGLGGSSSGSCSCKYCYSCSYI